MNSKEAYIAFCKKVKYLPFFYEPAWWDLLSKDWQVIQYEHAGLDFFIPFLSEKKIAFTLIRNPHLTPYSGILYDFNNNLNDADLKVAFAKGLALMPNSSALELDSYPNAFPSNATASIKITHVLNITDKDTIYGTFKKALKRQLKKADLNLIVQTSADIKPLLSLNSASLKRQNTTQHFDTQLAEKLFDYSKKESKGQLFYNRDEHGNIHAGLWVVYDREKMYYLLGGSNPDFLGSGAMGQLLWTAIQLCIDLKLSQFDFEGSNVPGIARFFKTFGAYEVLYPVLTKPTNRILSLLQRIKKA